MDTPIYDFVRRYAETDIKRLHMPGHKGQGILGFEKWDITEICGADALYEAEGIIAQSEENAAALFDTQRTVYSTEGSSQCIRAMLYLAVMNRKPGTKPVVVAARNAHKAFVYAAALLDLEVIWIRPDMRESLCGCHVSEEHLEKILKGLTEPPAAVEESFIPVSEEEPFEYLDKLEDAHMEIHDDTPGIVFLENRGE